MAAEAPEDLLTPEEAGEILRLDIKTLRRWRYERRGPSWFALNHRAVRYRRADVEEWIRAREAASKVAAK